MLGWRPPVIPPPSGYVIEDEPEIVSPVGIRLDYGPPAKPPEVCPPESWRNAFDAWWDDMNLPWGPQPSEFQKGMARHAYAAGRECGWAEMQAERKQRETTDG